jgi:hypothetical protein
MVLRSFVLLLAAYVLFHKLFPFDELAARLADVTIGDFMLVIFRTLTAIAAAAYLVFRGLSQPRLQDRDRIWCECWSALAFGVITMIFGSIVVALLERKGMTIGAAHWVARGILWLLF